MNCADINKHLDGFIDGDLAANDLQAFEEHVSNCPDCAEKVAAARALHAALYDNFAAPLPAAGFERRLFAEVRNHYKDDKPSRTRFRFATGFSLAAVASITLWFITSNYVPNGQLGQPQIISVAMNGAQPVRLMFDSTVEIEQANLSVELPDNVALDGYPGRRGLSWQTSLHKGQNVLSLPVVATGAGQGELRTQLNYDDKVKTFRVVLKTASNEAH